jgi:hypothetical protein
MLMRRHDPRDTDTIEDKPLQVPGSSPGRRRK